MSTYSVNKQTLIGAEIPTETRTYKPITHQQLMDLTLESVHQAGFELASEDYSGARDGMVANGRYAIRNVADSEMQLQIGWQNSYNKSLSLSLLLVHAFSFVKMVVYQEILVLSKRSIRALYRNSLLQLLQNISKEQEMCSNRYRKTVIK